MKFHILNRKVHYWLSAFVALPLMVIFTTGVLLQLKKKVAWIQPTELTGAGTVPSLSFDEILATCRRIPQLEIRSWDDVNRVDARPSRGMLKVLAKNGWEVQIDSATGRVLQVAYRRSDVLEALHDGSWFNDAVKYWLFLPAGFCLILLWMTGVYLFLLPYLTRRRRRQIVR